MKRGIYFAEREHCFVTVRSCRHNVVGQRFAAKIVAKRAPDFRQQIREANAGIRFVRIVWALWSVSEMCAA